MIDFCVSEGGIVSSERCVNGEVNSGACPVTLNAASSISSVGYEYVMSGV